MELLKIKTEHFEGPLDLMLFLIQKNEMDISGISIHQITDQYVQYIELMRELNFDVAADFLVMAATLIHLKSKRLLPEEQLAGQASKEDATPTEEELVRRLMEYKRFQEAAAKLKEQPILGQDIHSRPNVPPPEKQSVWREMSVTEITLAFQDVLKRSKKRTKVIIREPVSIPEKIDALGKILKVNEMVEFEKVWPETYDRHEVIATFLALLELARHKKLKIFQNQTFGTIFITLTGDLSDFDSSLATGFDYRVRQQIKPLEGSVQQ